MNATQRGEYQGKALQSQSRRNLFKRIVLLSAAGYVAPKAILISDAWACHMMSGIPDMKADGSVCL